MTIIRDIYRETLKKKRTMGPVDYNTEQLTDYDILLFKEGNHFRLYDKLGAHPVVKDGIEGIYFAVWAPNAKSVSVIGDFNGWNRESHRLASRWDSSGIWDGFVPGVKKGALYKYHIHSNHNDYRADKIDPFAFFSEIPPKTASIIWDLDYAWKDQKWMETRYKHNSHQAPMSIYEVHLGSWRRKVEEDNRWLSYREIAPLLIDYVKQMGFTHVEFLPVMEHPFYGSWGYQTLGYFAPTNRYGDPQDLMYLIDQLHQNGIGVILDWVPSHFPSDEHGLAYFDGTHLYEHDDPKKGFHPDWQCYVFNNGRNEIKEFLISSALFWLDKYHVDGLRVDAVASMLYLDYSRKDGEWIPNMYGGNENLESLAFIRQLNENIYKNYPDVQVVAEESTAWTKVSRPVYDGGLGFGLKWNMGWMHDTLKYFSKDSIYRKYHHNELTFSMLYAFTENFVLSISHDEVVHGKGSVIGKMPGDDWQKFANLRTLYSYMYAHPGKKLLFMGSEFAQWSEWKHDHSLEWHLAQYDRHYQVQHLIRDLNKVYRNEKALHECEFDDRGFEWIDGSDWEHSIISFMRKSPATGEMIVCACNFTPTPHQHYTLGVSTPGYWKEILNSDAKEYGGSGIGNLGGVWSNHYGYHGKPSSITITLPPLSIVYLKHQP